MLQGDNKLPARLKLIHLLIIFLALILLLLLIYVRPVKSYKCYLKMKSPEINELTMWHFQNLNEYISIVKKYPTKEQLSRFYPKMRLLNNDLGELGYSIEHIFGDDEFFLMLKSNCISTLPPLRWSYGISFWSYLLNGRSLIFYRSDKKVDDLCYGLGTYFVNEGELIINHKLRIELESFIWNYVETNKTNKEKYFAYCYYSKSDNTIEIICDIYSKINIESEFYQNLVQELNRLTRNEEVDSVYFSVKININDFDPM